MEIMQHEAPAPFSLLYFLNTLTHDTRLTRHEMIKYSHTERERDDRVHTQSTYSSTYFLVCHESLQVLSHSP